MCGDYKQTDVDFLMNKSKIYGDVVKTYKKLANNRKTIIYCNSIEYSKKIEKIFRACGYKIRQFDGNTSKTDRDEIIKQFKNNELEILVNVDLIGEGFNVPDCDCVVLLRPTQSVSLFIQQSTRCLRSKPGKHAIIIDFVGNVFRHGMPTENRNWTLSKQVRVINKNGDRDIIVRQCINCFRCYQGTSKICPYCEFDNGKTRNEIEQEKAIELEKITNVEKREKRLERVQATDYESLVQLGIQRGYKNPQWWARMILKGRGKNV